MLAHAVGSAEWTLVALVVFELVYHHCIRELLHLLRPAKNLQ